MDGRPQADGARSPDRPDMVALQAMLFDWRDALVNVSLALHDLHCAVDPEGRRRAMETVEQLLSKIAGP